MFAFLVRRSRRAAKADAEGANRARSASEAFLYRRLETLPETRRRFEMNADLPIAFGGWGRMEVDLLCSDSRVVVEIDGAQHLAVNRVRPLPADCQITISCVQLLTSV